jgi:hypothetical protein
MVDASSVMPSRRSPHVALVVASAIVLACTPLLFVGGRAAADASPPPDGARQ